ncbi:5290_t:CDS:10 [Funneliformis caledonium]|uniref:5290_t:CDS:1 n=1 Tax=Funneliformis caledonium TaxID=1117310 RepID=A0A9N9E414_9GLOM|nr:5290_t:CDS:10 [Funneliformis caledonium]
MASQNIPMPIDSLQKTLSRNSFLSMPSPGISSYFSNTEIEAWGYMGCLEYLAKVCVHLTSDDRDEILGKYRNHLHSIISSTSTLKKAKDRAYKLNDTAERSFQRIDTTLFFKDLIHRCVENTDMKDDHSYKRPRQAKIIAEEDKQQPYANTALKADGDNFDSRMKKIKMQKESKEPHSYAPSSRMDICSEYCSQQQTSSDSSSLLSVLKKYCTRNPPHYMTRSFIVDLSLSSKIKGQFSNEDWIKLVKRRPDVSINLIIMKSSLLFLTYLAKKWIYYKLAKNENDWEKIKRWVERVTGQFLDVFESLRNPLQNDCHEREWIGDYLVPLIQGVLKLDGNFYVPWGEISVLASLRRRNNDKDILIEQLERSHQVDLLCNNEQYEIACALACGYARRSRLKLLQVGKVGLRPYIIGIQSYMTEVRVYLMERREIYFLHHLKSFNLPLTFSTYHYLKVALRVAWNVRGLVNSLVRELETIVDDNDDGFKTPPIMLSVEN